MARYLGEKFLSDGLTGPHRCTQVTLDYSGYPFPVLFGNRSVETELLANHITRLLVSHFSLGVDL
jgi:hypothetical protein